MTAAETTGAAPDLPQAEHLIELGRDMLRLFHDQQDRPFAETVDGRGVVALPSQRAARILQLVFKRTYGRYPSPSAVANALEALATEAVLEGPRLAIYTRVGMSDRGHVVLDLASEHGGTVEIENGAWKPASEASVRFQRREGMQALPEPRVGCGIELLRKFVNVESDDDFMLVASWAAMTLSPVGPFPVLIIQGEQGSAKSTTCEVLKRLIDPTRAPLRAAPRSTRDLAIAAESNWILTLDNISYLPTWLSDALCRLSTGGGFGTRALYRDDEERVFEQQRPVILNGIDAVATRQDLLDRAIVLTLPRLESDSRQDERTFWAEFERARPLILGALLDGVAAADEDVDAVVLPEAPRMADFTRWAVAASRGFGWTRDAFLTAYAENRAVALKTSLDGSAVVKAIRVVLDINDGCIEGTPTQVFEQLRAHAPQHDNRQRGGFPSNPQRLGRHLRLLAGALRMEGIEVETGHLGIGSDKTRWVRITVVGDVETEGSDQEAVS
jgi:putative DNA primase/helicase